MIENVINDDLETFPVGFAMVGGRLAFEVALRSLTVGEHAGGPRTAERHSERLAMGAAGSPRTITS